MRHITRNKNMSKNVLDFKKYENLSRTNTHSSNNELSTQLKREQDIFIETITKLDENEEILKLIENGKTIPSKLSKTPTLDGVVGFICLALLIWMVMLGLDGEWLAVFGCFIGLGVIHNMWESYTKYTTKDLITTSNQVLKKQLDECLDTLSALVNHVLPEIHNLGLFDIENAKNKTSAKLLSIDFIQTMIIDNELEEGRIEKVAFTDQKSKQTQTLYRSLIAKENGDDDMEHIELQID